MNNVLKYAAAATLAGALAAGLSAPSQARDGRNAAAIGGFVAGAAVGAAVAGSANRGYYYDEPYAYEPGYYAYEPAYTYQPRYRYRSGSNSCSTSGTMYGHRQDYSACY